MIKTIIFIFVILLSFCSIANADLNFIIDQDYININSSCIISNTPQTIKIPIYTGINMIGISLYPDDPTLDAVFGDDPVNWDKVYRYIYGTGYVYAQYYSGIWYDPENVEPFEPGVGYRYERANGNFTLTINGTYLPKDENCSIYTFFNFKNRVGTNIIRPAWSAIYD